MKPPERRPNGKTNRYRESAVHKALAHPLRAHLLTLLVEGEMSPRGLADAIGQPIGSIAYHVKNLRDADLIELTRTQPSRGALEHFYRAKANDTLSVGLMLSAADARAFLTELGQLVDRYRAVGAGDGTAQVIVAAHKDGVDA